MSTNCDLITVIPQNTTTCWFNAILTSMLYSDRSKKYLLEKAKNWKGQNTNKFLQILKQILYYNVKNDNDKLRQLFQKYKIESILLLYMKNYDDKLYNILKYKLKEIYSFGFYILIIYMIFNKLNIDYLDITITTNDNYLNVYKNSYNIQDIFYINTSIDSNHIITDIEKILPKYIFFNDIEDEYPELYSDKNLNNHLRDNLRDHFEFNTYNYLMYKKNYYYLDSILLSNYNKISNGHHLIACITCDTEKYIYYGTPSNCRLIKYDWLTNLNKSFIIIDCTLIPIDDSKVEKFTELNINVYCPTKNYIYFYVKDDTDTNVSVINESSGNMKELRPIVEDFHKYSREELIKILQNVYYRDKQKNYDILTDDELLQEIKKWYNIPTEPINSDIKLLPRKPLEPLPQRKSAIKPLPIKPLEPLPQRNSAIKQLPIKPLEPLPQKNSAIKQLPIKPAERIPVPKLTHTLHRKPAGTSELNLPIFGGRSKRNLKVYRL